MTSDTDLTPCPFCATPIAPNLKRCPQCAGNLAKYERRGLNPFEQVVAATLGLIVVVTAIYVYVMLT